MSQKEDYAYLKRAKQSMENETESKVTWTPETPAKPSPQYLRQQVNVDRVGGNSDDSTFRVNLDELDATNQFFGGGSCGVIPPMETNVTNAAPVVDGGEASDVLRQCDKQGGESLIPPSSSKKRRTNPKNESANESQKKPKKKVYRPKILVDEFQKKAKVRTPKKPPQPKAEPKDKTKAKNAPKTPMKTPEPRSAPHKKKGGGGSGGEIRKFCCKLSLLPLLNDDLNAEESVASFPFLPNPIQEQSDFSSTIYKNSLGSHYNMLGNYKALCSLSSTCLIQSRQVGVNFPIACKRKRLKRTRMRLEKLLAPFKKGPRSNGFIRKKRTVFNIESIGIPVIVTKTMESLVLRIQKLKMMMKKKKNKKRGKTKKDDNEIIVYNKGLGDGNQMVLYKGRKFIPEVALDEETLRMWSLIKDGNEDYKETDEEKQKHWEQERNTYYCRVKNFMDIMHMVQGDRRFSPWKGSVLDSLVGAFLTQNVSDHLSSSAYMSLAAKFPLKTTSSQVLTIKDIEDMATPDSQESVESNVVFPAPELLKELEDITVEHMKAQKAKESSQANKEEEEIKFFKKVDKEKEEYWEGLRKKHTPMTRESDNSDSVDWEAVRCAQVSEIAEAITTRGQHNVIAKRIWGLLNEMKEKYGNLDLEWLRYAPPQDAKEYLLNIYGVGLKSVECIRLLTLGHKAFPVDVNVGRIAVRLGWVPLQPLPDEFQIHNLQEYPVFDSIQKYLWTRIGTLDPLDLYNFHYQLITFGKVFCTKKNPNCIACPMKPQCRHFASACASGNFALPEPEKRTSEDKSEAMHSTANYPFFDLLRLTLPETVSEVTDQPSTVEEHPVQNECEPIVEMPPSPELKSVAYTEFEEESDDDENGEDEDGMLTIDISSQERAAKNAMMNNALSAHASNNPAPKMKNTTRLRTERRVYVLPHGHPLLADRTPPDPDEPYNYLLVIWTKEELEKKSTEELENGSSESSNMYVWQEEDDGLTVRGTLLIPCRTAMRGRFPLNGTYFQVNEVFADFDSMKNPISVPREWIWNLEQRIAHFGTGTSAILRGLPIQRIQYCFWRGYVCVRAMDAKTGAPRPLSAIFHKKTTAKVGKGNKKNAKEGKQPAN